MASGSGSGTGLGGSSLVSSGALDGPDVASGEVYRLVTSGFLHAGFIHLALNMYILWILGTMFESSVGRLRFLLIYFVAMLSGAFGALLLTPNAYTVGASGAIFGLMGAGVIVLRSRGIDPMQSGLPVLIGINLLFSFAVSGISIGGHIGGLIGGALAAMALDAPERIRGLPRAVGPVLAGAVGALAVAASLAVA
jgi:membrane associated rhomboid family serine protease